MTVTVKPLNVQFEIEDEKTIDEVLEIAAEFAKKRGDRRLRAANLAKEVFLRVLHDYPQLIQDFMNDESSIGIGDTPSPKERAATPTAKKKSA